MRFMLLSLLFFSLQAFSCTTFSLASKERKLLGKSYDWHLMHGMVLVNKRNVSKRAVSLKPFENPVSWKSKYGTVTYNQYGREFPLSGYNEKGLAVEIMWLDETEYPTKDDRQSINELQWVQYQLDNFATVAEVVANVEQIRIAKVDGDVHFLACDSSGACATIEFLKGKAVVHTGASLRYKLLANDTYKNSLDYLFKHVGFGGTLPIQPKSMASLDRFARTASLVAQAPATQDAAYDILRSVKQAGGYSVWNVVYDLTSGRMSFRTSSKPSVREFDTRAFDYSCKTPVAMLNMADELSGDVTTRFTEYDPELNEEMVRKGFGGNPLGKLIVNKVAYYPETTNCEE